jgi:hypothetical protein
MLFSMKRFFKMKYERDTHAVTVRTPVMKIATSGLKRFFALMGLNRTGNHMASPMSACNVLTTRLSASAGKKSIPKKIIKMPIWMSVIIIQMTAYAKR